MTEYLVFTREQYEAGIEEMASNMFHGGFMTRRAIGEPVKGVIVTPAPHTHADGKCSRPDLHNPRPASPVDGEGRPDGAARIAAERQRQIDTEGWTPEHDDEHCFGEIAGAASAYAALASRQEGSGLHEAEATKPPSQTWRWGHAQWKPSNDPIRNLVKAGALIATEIDRLDRAAADRGGEA